MSDQIFVTRSSMPELNEYMEEIKGLWKSHWLTNMGIKHEQLRMQLCKYLGLKNIELFTNGHMALELTLKAMNLHGEIITTPFTFASTTHAIVRNGLTPVFCDINPVDFTIDTSKIEMLITDKTSAIMPVHVYGNVCNVEEIECIAKKYHLKVIYDAAHTFGVKYKGKGIGNFGDASCFSFHATKVFNTIEGGAVSFQDPNLDFVLKKVKNFGIVDAETVDEIGVNAKMNEFCAAMGLCNLRHIDEEISKREKVVSCYREYLGDVEGLQLNPIQKDVKTNYAYFPVVFDAKKFGVDRDKVFEKLAERGIGARKYFYPLTNVFDCYKDKYDSRLTPIALDISRRVLTLPLYADMNLANVEQICKIILDCRR